MVTASIGVAIIPMDGDDPGRLLQNADIALYRAKTEGRNRFRFFEPGMDAELRERKAARGRAAPRGRAAASSRSTISRRSTCAAAGSPGVEALVRWNHPERGLLPAAAFIQIAEETGLLLAIGEWLIADRLPPGRGLARAAGCRSISRRCSSSTTTWSALIRRQRSRARGLAPDRLELEIAESVLLHDIRAPRC